MRRSWDAGRKWGARLWKVEIRVVAHHGLMTGSLPEARLSPPAQPKQKQIIVFKCDRSSVNVLSYAKEIPIVDKMASQFYLPVARIIIIILSLLTLSGAHLFCTFGSTINMWRLGENDVSGESSLSVGGGGWRGTGVQRWREVKPQEALQHKQWVTVCVAEALLDLRNCGAWPTKQKQAEPVCANVNTCVYACALASVCLKPQHCTGKHLFQPVRSAANLSSNQTTFFFCLVSEVPFESSQTPSALPVSIKNFSEGRCWCKKMWWMRCVVE